MQYMWQCLREGQCSRALYKVPECLFFQVHFVFKKRLYFIKRIFSLSANHVPESSLELRTHNLRHFQWHWESHRLEMINSYGSNQEPSEIKVQLV